MAKQTKSLHSNLHDDVSASANLISDMKQADSESSDAPSELNLTHHFLIAMPSMQDPVFGGTVIYLCEHSPRGAMGVIINQPTDMTVAGLFERIELKLENIPDSHPMGKHLVLFGGPVQEDRGFVLHAPAGQYTSSLKVTDNIAFTTSRDVLEAVASGDGPERVLISVGYAGWSAGQLEKEILANGWLTVAADEAILFDLPLEERFNAAIKLLGIDPLMLAAEAGHA